MLQSSGDCSVGSIEPISCHRHCTASPEVTERTRFSSERVPTIIVSNYVKIQKISEKFAVRISDRAIRRETEKFEAKKIHKHTCKKGGFLAKSDP